MPIASLTSNGDSMINAENLFCPYLMKSTCYSSSNQSMRIFYKRVECGSEFGLKVMCTTKQQHGLKKR